MAELTVHLTYGNALFQAARELNKEEQILEEGRQLVDLFEKEADLYTLINYPSISGAEKKAVLKTIFEGRICQELLNLLYVLIDKSRTRHFFRIIKAYEDLINREEGCTYGTIYSVMPLSREKMEEFEGQTSALLRSNVKLENKTDASLIAGVKILVDGRMIDASVRKRLDDLRSEIMNGREES